MKHSFFLLIAFAIIAGSCSKNNDTVSPGGPGISGGSTARLKTSSDDYGTTTYEHDSKGRVVKETYPNGGHDEYIYTANTVTINEYGPGNNLVAVGTYELNADGLTTKKSWSDTPNGFTEYLYNPDKTTSKKISTYNGNTSVFDYFYTNGNLDSTRIKYNGTWNSTIIPSYYDKADGLGEDIFGVTFYGKTNKKLLKSEFTRTKDGDEYTFNYTYDFDSNGRVIKRTSQNGQNINITYYTYY